MIPIINRIHEILNIDDPAKCWNVDTTRHSTNMNGIPAARCPDRKLTYTIRRLMYERYLGRKLTNGESVKPRKELCTSKLCCNPAHSRLLIKGAKDGPSTSTDT